MGRCCVPRIQVVFLSLYHADEWKDALEDFDDFIPYAVASLGFVVCFTTKAVVSVRVKCGATFAFVVGGIVDDWEAEFPLERCTKGLVLDTVFFGNSAHRH